MGCDIHAIVERRDTRSDGTHRRWLNSGEPDIGRDYEVFAALAGVRNYDEVEPVSEPKGMPGWGGWVEHGDDGWGQWDYSNAPDTPYQDYFERWRHDAHSASWLSLAELKAYDTEQEVDDQRLIIAREGTSVTALCRSTSGKHEGPVGRRRIFVWPGEDEAKPTSWDRLVAYLEGVRAQHDLGDDDVRLVFFFDN
jgi:hypothetical protein